MKKHIFAVAAAASLVGCGDTERDKQASELEGLRKERASAKYAFNQYATKLVAIEVTQIIPTQDRTKQDLSVRNIEKKFVLYVPDFVLGSFKEGRFPDEYQSPPHNNYLLETPYAIEKPSDDGKTIRTEYGLIKEVAQLISLYLEIGKVIQSPAKPSQKVLTNPLKTSAVNWTDKFTTPTSSSYKNGRC